ncbi:MAG: Gfo/Idh/MocA family oxidoreductase [Verrucomicrobiae bacterium]|jgi:predicted dehydrogenase|nr:Gfo/Idh/MocA family oxidoreductase [Verrucomicrobiae bacterium]
MKTTRFDRRSFLKTSGFGVSAFYIAKTSWAQSSPGDTLNTAVIGVNGRGRSHIDATLSNKHKSVRLSAICDVDAKVLSQRAADLKKRKVDVTTYSDMRKLFENKDIDIITVATPNHWHSLAAIWAVQAGKDVYCEKPVSHNVWEGRQLVKAARKYKRIVQTGTQSRSSDGLQAAVKWIHEGGLGKIEIARGLCYKSRPSIGHVDAPVPIPEYIDYDLWSGPAPLVPSTRNNPKKGPVHYDWHWIWNYGNGDLGNQGIHQMDIARWFLGEKRLSPRVWSLGGRVGYVDDGETPNTQIVYHDYKSAPLIFEVRGLPETKGGKDMPKYMGAGVGVILHCEDGYVSIPSYTSANVFDKAGKPIREFKSKIQGTDAHFANFIDAVRSRKHQDLNADIEDGHISSALCHTGNISYRLGKQASPQALAEFVKGERGGSETLERTLEHLAKNEVDISKEKLVLGPALEMNPKTERFPGNEAANALLTRDYRKPYVVPENI